MTFIKKIPIPMAVLILAIVSLGNFMIHENLNNFGAVLVWVGIFLIILLSIRVITDFEAIKNDFKNPMIASVSPTFTMALFGIAAYLHHFESLVSFSTILWYLAIALHLAFMGYFTYQFVIKRDLTIQSLYPSWFITYIGIGVIAFTSPNFNLFVGKVFLVLCVINYFVLVPLMLYRVFRTKYDEQPTLPLLTILTAPTSLFLAGFLSIAANPNHAFVVVVLIISQLLYLVALYFLKNIVSLSFYPSFAAFTFPLVITAIAASLANDLLNIPYFNIIVDVEVFISMAVTLFVYIRYMMFLTNATLAQKSAALQQSK